MQYNLGTRQSDPPPRLTASGIGNISSTGCTSHVGGFLSLGLHEAGGELGGVTPTLGRFGPRKCHQLSKGLRSTRQPPNRG